MKILLLGGGRRVNLANQLIRSGKRYGQDVSIYSYEMSTQTCISKVGSVCVGKRWSDPNVKEDILNLIEKESISLVVSCVDDAVRIHAEMRDLHRSLSISSKPSSVEVCSSKRRFFDFCKEEGIRVLPYWDGKTIPAFAKPDRGSASEGARVINNFIDAKTLEKDPSLIVQDLIVGTEISVDGYRSLKKNRSVVSPRVRQRTCGGEVTSSTTIYDEEIARASIRIAERLGLAGPFTIQFIRQNETQLLYAMEVNSRFGGGVCLSIHAGCNTADYLIAEILGLEVAMCGAEAGVKVERYLDDVFFK